MRWPPVAIQTVAGHPGHPMPGNYSLNPALHPHLCSLKETSFFNGTSLSLPSACFMGILHACLILIWIHGCLFFLRSLSITDTAWRCSSVCEIKVKAKGKVSRMFGLTSMEISTNGILLQPPFSQSQRHLNEAKTERKMYISKLDVPVTFSVCAFLIHLDAEKYKTQF